MPRHVSPLNLLLLLALAACAAPPATEDTAARVFIVRHAEKLAGEDPALSAAGTVRAKALAERLAHAGIARIYSTDTRRTRETAAPLAHALGITPEIYDAAMQDALALRVAARHETVLIVGHSNTITELAAAFGVEPGGPVDEATEFDRLYEIALEPRGVVLHRYGN